MENPNDFEPSTPATPPGNDVDAGVLATGCGWSCGLGCLLVLVIFALVALAGAEAVRRGNLGFVMIIGALGGAAIHVAVGYFTARAAREKGAQPNIHVIILGVILMVVGLYSFVAPQKQQLPQQIQALAKALSILGWIATIPLMLCGASLAQQDE